MALPGQITDTGNRLYPALPVISGHATGTNQFIPLHMRVKQK